MAVTSIAGLTSAALHNINHLLYKMTFIRNSFSNIQNKFKLWLPFNKLQNKKDDEKVFCEVPFVHARINSQADLMLCCKPLLNTPAGKVTSGENINSVWNSKIAQNIRKSILDNSFSYCNADKCPKLRSKTLPKISEIEDPFLKEIIRKKKVVIAHGPKLIELNYDRSCNLSCPQCRDHVIQFKGKELEKVKSIHEIVIEQYMGYVDEIIITGAGDAFGSPLFRKFLQTYDFNQHKNMTIVLRHNGTLLTQSIWDSLKIHNHTIYMIVSIDAAKKETFELLRRGGKWDKLNEVMELCKKLRCSNEIKKLTLAFAYNQINYNEMPYFVDLGIKWSADLITFRPLRPDAEFTGDKYDQLNIFSSTHPEHDKFHNIVRKTMKKSNMIKLDFSVSPEIYDE